VRARVFLTAAIKKMYRKIRGRAITIVAVRIVQRSSISCLNNNSIIVWSRGLWKANYSPPQTCPRLRVINVVAGER